MHKQDRYTFICKDPITNFTTLGMWDDSVVIPAIPSNSWLSESVFIMFLFILNTMIYEVKQQIQSDAAFDSSPLHTDPQRHAHIRSGCMWNHLQLHQHFLYIQLPVQRKANEPRMGPSIPAGLQTSV